MLLLVALAPAPKAAAQSWVAEMFETTSHDFGVVPRGANASYAFVLTNKYQEDVHIAAVRSSCGCTEPIIEKALLKTYEKGAILCKFNTRSFVGPRSAVVTVVFDKPYYGELQLLVRGTIRSDIVTEPGEIDFGEVPLGTEAMTQLRISHAGTGNWKIEDVRSANEHLGVRLERQSDPAGRTVYVMRVRLKDTAPAGAINDQIVLVTNETGYNLVTLPVRGVVVPPLVMPQSVELGTVPLNAELTKSLFIKGNEPFRIKQVSCDDPRFEFETPEGQRKAHVIRFAFRAGGQPGAFRRTVTVTTDLDGDSQVTTVIRGNVAED
ncbi:MAG: DUF1573 domain-containing protein [Planctomycetota bacterium]|nr:MAG: DUF1573 domain-containing protein [Planctomycetota bacterium]